jgi:hypothetical protein
LRNQLFFNKGKIDMKKILLIAGAYALSYILISKALKNKDSILCKYIDSGAEKINSFLDDFLKNKSLSSSKHTGEDSNKEKEGENFLAQNEYLEKDKNNKMKKGKDADQKNGEFTSTPFRSPM